MSYSVIRSVAKEEEPEQKLIIKRIKMEDREESGISEEELTKLMKDMENTPDDEMEYLGDEDLDDADVDEIADEDEFSPDDEDDDDMGDSDVTDSDTDDQAKGKLLKKLS
jgi:hypothetical protein